MGKPNNRLARSLSIAVALALIFSASFVTRGQDATQGPAKPTTTKGILTIRLESKLMNAVMPYNVILPIDYKSSQSRKKRYSVLYLLHGLMGHYSDWTSRTRLTDYARQYRIIIVTPEGNDGWYTDSATVPHDKYESYILEELIPDVQHRFRAYDTRDGRAVAGLSMGGYGALKFAIKHPALFIFAGSMSGAFDAASWTKEDLSRQDAIFRSLQPVFGPSDSPVRAANDLNKLYEHIAPEQVSKLPYLYLDCGTEDQLLSVNLKLANTILAKKIPHEFRLLPGAHDWKYWNQQVVEVLRVAVPRLRAATVQ